MADSDVARLGREVSSFTRYLVGRPPTQRLVLRYAEALATLGLAHPATAFDGRLLRTALVHPFATEMLDTACALLAKDSLLRRRLFVLAGLLETEPTFAELFVGQPPGRIRIAVGLLGAGTRAGLSFILGAPMLLALRWTS